MKNSTNVFAREVAKEMFVTVEVKGLNEMRMRIWLATQIIRLGIWVVGMQCKIKEWK